MTTLTEDTYPGEFLLGEDAPEFISRDKVTITGSAAYPAGQVLGKITASGKYTIHNPSVSPADGSEAAAAILYAPVDPSAGDVLGTIVDRLAEVNGNLLTWVSGISGGNKTAGIAALLTHNIVVR
jgi:hypothetical protein